MSRVSRNIALAVVGALAAACAQVAVHPWLAVAAEPQECFLMQVGEEDNQNLFYPDTAVSYFRGRVTIPPEGELMLRGRFPHSRYMSFNAYDDMGRPTDALADFEIKPGTGSTNPFIDGARRDDPMRSYLVRIVPDSEPETREPNTLYLGNGGRPAFSGWVTYRIYLPDRGRDKFGGTGMPEVSWRLADGSEVDQPLACSALTDQPSTGITDIDRRSSGPTTPDWGTASDPLSWEKFFTAPRAVVRQASEEVADEMPAPNEGGFFSDHNNAYVYAYTARHFGDVLVVTGRIPEVANTYDGDRIFRDGQVRYWSLCQAAAAPTGVTDTVDCIFDERVPTDAKGNFTIVVSTPSDRPANARPGCGVGWLAYGARPDGGLIMRNQLPADDFDHAVQSIAEPDAEAQVLGEYMPHGTYTTTETFEARGCSPRDPSARRHGP